MIATVNSPWALRSRILSGLGSCSKNGVSPPLKKFQMETISDIVSCFELWKKFSPRKTLFDVWEFRLAFYKAYKYKPCFLLLKNRSQELALLPLWYEDDTQRYCWFGGDWQEEVRFFSKRPNYIPILLSLAPSPLLLNAIAQDAIRPLKREVRFEEDEPKYILDLSKFRNHEDYLATIKKKTRQNLRRNRKKIEAQNPEIVIDNLSDFEHLVRLSEERFKQKREETDWKDARRVEAFRQVIKLAGESYKVRMITVLIGKKIAGVDLIALFNGCYYTLRCGYNVRSFPGIGSFFNLLEIDDAIGLGMKKVDFLQDSYEWKNLFFQTVPLFRYEKLACPHVREQRQPLMTARTSGSFLETAQGI